MTLLEKNIAVSEHWLLFFVQGIPEPKIRIRFHVIGEKLYRLPSAQTTNWEWCVREVASEALGRVKSDWGLQGYIDEEVEVAIELWITEDSKADLDNLVKAVLDGLCPSASKVRPKEFKNRRMGLLKNDKLVKSLKARLRVVKPDLTGALILIKRLSPQLKYQADFEGWFPSEFYHLVTSERDQ